MMNDNKKGVVVLATGNKREFYDIIVSDILSGNIDQINEMVGKEKTILLSYDSFVGKSGENYEGFDKLFKLDGLVELINRYFLENKLGLVANKEIYSNRNVISVTKFQRFERKGGENGIISKVDRRTDKDDIAIIENLSKDSDKEKIAKKIEESRKLIKEG
jgi:hypothetical protein